MLAIIVTIPMLITSLLSFCTQIQGVILLLSLAFNFFKLCSLEDTGQKKKLLFMR